MSDDDAHRPPAHDERNVERGRDAHSASSLLIDLRVVQHGVDPLAPSPLEYTARLRAAELERHSDQAVCIRAFSVGCSDAEPVGAGVGRAMSTSRAWMRLLSLPRDQAEQRLELEFARECVSDLVHRLEVAQPPRGRLVQASVLDCHGGLCGQKLCQLLVLVGEVASAELLRQVQVSVRDTAKEDRNAEEALHRRMVGRKSDGARIVAEVMQPQAAARRG